MEPLATVILIPFLDPVRALITFGCTFLSRRSYCVLVAASASEVVCETILTLARMDLPLVQDIAGGFIAALLQATALVWTMRAIRRRHPKQPTLPVQQ
jgi:hypothetical protein